MAARGASRDERVERADHREPRHRSRDRVADLSRRRGRSLHEADANAHSFSGRQGRRVERSLSKLCRHARTRDAISWPFTGRRPDKLGSWLDDASHSGIHALQQFARILARDIDAVGNAIAEPWSSGQAEGQINRLKTLKRAMFGRAGIELLRARMLPLQ